MDRHHLPGRACRYVGAPLIHQPPAPVEEVGPEIGALDTRDGMGKGGLGNLSRFARFGAPVAKAGSAPVNRGPIGETRVPQYLGQRHVGQGRPRFIGDGKTNPDPSSSARAFSSTATAASDNGTRCSVAAFILAAGIVQVRVAMSISPQTAPRASPDLTAVSTTSRRQSFAAVSPCTISRAAPTSEYGNARRGARQYCKIAVNRQ